uniref:G_PROTEIN_RECEP_F1_2 domain-containing protein n=1 Tax=Steinernema glaseri TaxID=37863 RepID=A0A1I7YJS7_9BILA
MVTVTIFRLEHVFGFSQVQLLLAMTVYASLKLCYPTVLSRIDRRAGFIVVLLMALFPLTFVAFEPSKEGQPNCLEADFNTVLFAGVVLAVSSVFMYAATAFWAIYSISKVSCRRKVRPSIETVRLVQAVVRNFIVSMLLVLLLVGIPFASLVTLALLGTTTVSGELLFQISFALIVSYSPVSTIASLIIFAPYRSHTLKMLSRIRWFVLHWS